MVTGASAGTAVATSDTTVVSTGSGSGGRGGKAHNTFTLSGDLDWEIDLWGRIRRNVESQEANVQASEADLASATLSKPGYAGAGLF